MSRENTSGASDYSTSAACCQATSIGFEFAQMTTQKRRPLTDEELADTERLKKIIQDKKRTHGMTQQAIGLSCGWAGQQAVQAFVSGNTPLNLDAAFRFSKALDVTLDEISPRLAAKVVELFGATAAGRARPQTFEEVLADHAAEIAALQEADRLAVDAMKAAAARDPQASQKYIKTLKALLEH